MITFNYLWRTFSNPTPLKMKHLIFVCFIFLFARSNAQLANGSIAPDFTLTDYYGTTHHLYTYLNSGKTVFLEIFAAHCPVCWAYGQTDILNNMFLNYGPMGTNEMVVIALEYDQWNDSNAFIGNGPPWVTQGNWLLNTSFPIINVEDPDRTIFIDYNVSFYPLIYKICPDKIIERIMTNETEAQLYQKVQNCTSVMSINENKNSIVPYVDQHSKTLFLKGLENASSIQISNLQGQLIKHLNPTNNQAISLNDLAGGLYIYSVQTKNKVLVNKIIIP